MLAAGCTLRPNKSLAGVFGSSGLASGGRTLVSSVPRSCAAAIVPPAISRTAVRARREAQRNRDMPHSYSSPFGRAIAVTVAREAQRALCTLFTGCDLYKPRSLAKIFLGFGKLYFLENRNASPDRRGDGGRCNCRLACVC